MASFAYIRLIGCDQTMGTDANLLDEGIDDTAASVGAKIAPHEIPFQQSAW